MSNVIPYDAKNIFASLGVVSVQGFMPDSFLSIEYNNDFWTVQVGVDGKSNTRSKNNDRSAIITLSILQTSPTHDQLSAQLALDEAGNVGQAPLLIKDNSTGALFTARNCWIKKPPTAVFSGEAQGWEWTLETDRLVAVYGDPLFRTP